MAEPNAISDLQAVDFAMGAVLVGAYDGLNDDRPEAFARFLDREPKEKIYRVENEDPPGLLRRIAGNKQKGEISLDLPVIAYYRAPGIVGNVSEKPAVLSVERHVREDRGLMLSTIPVTLTYTILWCAWDKPALDKIVLAWFCYVAQRGRRNSRFYVPYLLDDEIINIPSSISAPREILADNSSPDQATGRLWAAKAMVEVNTQVLYGRMTKPVDEITVLTSVRLHP